MTSDGSGKEQSPSATIDLTASLAQATCVLDALEDGKARDVQRLEVARLTDITDYMVLASGTSNRHVKALVDRVEFAVKQAGYRVLGIEGRELNEWVLIDLGDVVVHVMQTEARAFYDLERLWAPLPSDSESSV